jgi:DNA end-binding protein Ku
MVKGYEFAKDQYVTFEPQEIKALEEAGTHAIDITEFVPIESVDPVYFDKTYYLAPDKGGAKPYALLTEALKQANRCAIGHWAARGKAYLVMLRPVGSRLTLQQLHFAADVRPASEIEVPPQDVKPTELKLAQQLINQQTAEKFEPTAYTDDLRARIQAAIDKKVEGQQISVADFPAEGGGGKVIDLMEALRASLEKADAARASTAQLGPRRAPKRAEAPAPQEQEQDQQPAARRSRKAGKR